jgi:hypothetical protein
LARGDVVVAELREHRVVDTVQQTNLPGGADPRHRAHRAVPHDGQHHIQQFGGHRGGVGAIQRRPHFGAGIGARRQFQVPTRVEAAGATAQRDAIQREIAGRRVEVHRVQ